MSPSQRVAPLLQRLLLPLLLVVFVSLSSAPGGSMVRASARSYCYDNCSDHGRCVDNICRCDPGFHGENCALHFGLPPLSQGTANLTSSAQARQYFASHDAVLVGVSMTTCAKCASVEDEYHSAMRDLAVPLARVDAAKCPELLPDLGLTPDMQLPILVLVWERGRRHGLYRGLHESRALVEFVNEKVVGAGFRELAASDVRALEDSAQAGSALLGLPAGHYVAAVALFASASPKDSHEADEFEEFLEAVQALRSVHNVRLFVWYGYKPRRGSERRAVDFLGSLPALIMLSADGRLLASSTLTEPLELEKGTPAKLSSWIAQQATPDVARLTAASFANAELAALPMLLVFTPDPQPPPGLLDALREVAREFRGKIAFLYGHQAAFEQRMHTLGLAAVSGGEAVMALNTMDLGPLPYSGSDEVDLRSMRRFCIEYLAGRLAKLEDFTLGHRRDALKEQEQAVPEQDVTGVSEGFYRSDAGLTLIESEQEWTSLALDETEDAVVVVFKSSQCPKCRALAPYVKRVAERFSKLPGHRVLVCALDLAKFHPASLADAAVPSLLMLPAFHKSPPFRFYSGQGKVFPIMDWVRANAGHKFEFREELPQFDDEQKRLFREQIQQREVKRREAGKPPQQQQQQQQQQDQDQVREDL